MYTLLELKDKRGLLIDENIALTQKAEKETRKLTEDEQKLFDKNLESITQLEKDILVEEELRKIPVGKNIVGKDLEEGKPFSMFRAIDNVINIKSVSNSGMFNITQKN